VGQNGERGRGVVRGGSFRKNNQRKKRPLGEKTLKIGGEGKAPIEYREEGEGPKWTGSSPVG